MALSCKVYATVISLTWESPYLGNTVFILRWRPGFLHQQDITSHLIGCNEWVLLSDFNYLLNISVICGIVMYLESKSMAEHPPMVSSYLSAATHQWVLPQSRWPLFQPGHTRSQEVGRPGSWHESWGECGPQSSCFLTGPRRQPGRPCQWPPRLSPPGGRCFRYTSYNHSPRYWIYNNKKRG